MTDVPHRAYPTGSGHQAGSDTSRQREQGTDADGTTASIQARVLDVLRLRPLGLTWKQVDDLAKIGHHGRTSSALTNLRKQGQVFWLHEVREGCHVFVHEVWRDRYRLEQIKLDAPRVTADKGAAAEQVCIGFAAYLADPTTDRWDFIKAAHAQWVKL